MSDDHYHVGRQHGQAGERRYKFQDPHLQAEYDRGYDEAMMEWNTIQKTPPPSFDEVYAFHKRIIPGRR